MTYTTIYKHTFSRSDISPLELLYRIKDRQLPFLLDSAKGDKRQGRKSYLGFDPVQTLRSKGGVTELEGEMEGTINDAHPLELLRTLMEKYRCKDAFPFSGGAVGCMSYDFTAYNLGIPLRSAKLAEVYDCYFGIYTAVLEYDTETRELTLFYQNDSELKDWMAILESEETPLPEAAVAALERGYASTESIAIPDEQPYREAFREIRRHIRKGDVYEVNLSHSFIAEAPEDAFTQYCLLRQSNPADFAAYMDFGPYAVLSSSPERFFECRDRRVTTRPIKGTAARGKTPGEDAVVADELLHSEKNISELLMIVDLMRNDLARSCDYKSMQVNELYRLETYETVHHLVSTICGVLREGEDAISLTKNIFPGGSITGAPKRAAIQIIDEVEQHARGIYTGSLGYFGFNGNADFNILIRTILKTGDTSYFYGGGAVTWDSEEESELEETIDKCVPILRTFVPIDNNDDESEH